MPHVLSYGELSAMKFRSEIASSTSSDYGIGSGTRKALVMECVPGDRRATRYIVSSTAYDDAVFEHLAPAIDCYNRRS